MRSLTSQKLSLRFVALGITTLVLITLAAGVLMAVPANTAPRAASAATVPAVQITPNHGPYHTVTVVTGQGFGANEQVAIFKETRAFFAYNTDASGSFVGAPHPLIGPGPLNGIITITAIGRTTGRKATTIFTVTP